MAKIGPWPLGMDNVDDDTELPTDRNGNVVAATDCYNGDFNSNGKFAVRPGFAKVSAEAGMHSLWSPRLNAAYALAVRGTELVRLTMAGETIDVEPLADLPSNAPMSFDSYGGMQVYATRDVIGVVAQAAGAIPIAPPDATRPIATVSVGIGGLYEGRYSIAYAWADEKGREGALSDMVTIDVPQGGGISLSFPDAGGQPGAVRRVVYRSPANGDKLYYAADALAAQTYLILGERNLGRATDTQFLRRMTGGQFVRGWRGRLLVANGRTLKISDPLNYGLYSPRHGFVQFPERITFIEGVEGGVYVGQGTGVVFLDGSRPGEWNAKDTGGGPPVPGSSMLVSSDLFDPQLQLPPGDCAVWLASNGYVLGQPSGQISEPQAKRISLPATAAGKTAVFDRRLITITQ